MQKADGKENQHNNSMRQSSARYAVNQTKKSFLTQTTHVKSTATTVCHVDLVQHPEHEASGSFH